MTTNERACSRCALAPVCLPEEERLAKDPDWQPLQLTPRDDDRQTIHVLTHGSRVGRAGDELKVEPREGDATRLPVQTVGHLVLHGHSQVSTQALHLCAEKGVSVSWISTGGRFVGSLATGTGAVHRRIRQFTALSDEARRLDLTKRLVAAKVENGLRFVLRATRGAGGRTDVLERSLAGMRHALRSLHTASTPDQVLGYEGEAAARYFETWSGLIAESVDPTLRYVARTRRPPRDRVSAILGFAYALLLSDVTTATITVGLDPAFGFYHRPRSAAPPLALDLMELFRGPIVDVAVIGSINRGQWDPESDFSTARERVWLSESGRRKAIDMYERRKAESWRHPVVGYSLSYDRLIELESRLLEKEWTHSPGLFARFRIR